MTKGSSSRQQRRAEKKRLKKIGKNKSLEQQIAESMKAVTVDVLSSSDEPAVFPSLIEMVGDFAGDIVEKNYEQNPPPKHLACCAGCKYCCYSSHILVTAPEVLALKSFADETLSEEQKKDLQKRVENCVPEPGKELKPCPFLVDDKCSVYSVRPMMCRAYNSMDLSACKIRYDGDETAEVPVYNPQKVIYDYAQSGILHGAIAKGYSDERLDFRKALKKAFSDKDIIKKWRNKEKVFDGAFME